MAKKLNSNQKMFLNIVGAKAFPEMNSARIVEDLKNNSKLWMACTIEKKGTWKDNGGSFSITMSDFLDSRGKEDTLSICCTNFDNNKLFEVASGWGADEIKWAEKRSSSKDELAGLELMWKRER